VNSNEKKGALSFPSVRLSPDGPRSSLISSVHFYITYVVEILTRLYGIDDDASASRSFVNWVKNWLTNRYLVTPT
jgi:hypothetical protein